MWEIPKCGTPPDWLKIQPKKEENAEVNKARKNGRYESSGTLYMKLQNLVFVLLIFYLSWVLTMPLFFLLESSIYSVPPYNGNM